MKEYQSCDNEFLSLIINYPDFLERTIVKEEYLEPQARTLFNILNQEYKDAKAFIVERLVKNKNFDINYYLQLLNNNIYNSSKDIKFNEFEKFLIDRYKQNQYLELTKNFDGDCNKLYNNLTKINEIDYNENDYIKAKEIYETLTKKNKKVNLGYSMLDKSLNLSQTDMIIIGAGTGVGKTSFALNLLNNLSGNNQCIYFNMEMSKTVLYKRLLANFAEITLQELNDINSLSIEKKELLKNAMEILEERKIILVNKSLDIESIRKIVSNVKSEKPIIVFIDHIGLVKTKGNSLYEKMTNVAKELRTMCLNENCTIIGLCQLGREAQKSEDRPRLQDLRDSGEIEQSSRKTILLYNKTQNKQDRIQDIEVIIAKNDDGEKGIKEFKFDRYTQTFKEIDR